jgi:hypothetical protein
VLNGVYPFKAFYQAVPGVPLKLLGIFQGMDRRLVVEIRYPHLVDGKAVGVLEIVDFVVRQVEPGDVVPDIGV